MYNYHRIKSWHDTLDRAEKSSGDSSIRVSDTEDSFSRHYVKTKLENGLLRVWRVSLNFKLIVSNIIENC